MEQVTAKQLYAMLEKGELSPSLYYRRRTLIAIAELAKDSGGHTPATRRRLKAFREYLAQEQNNDEVEVTGEILCEVVLLALGALSRDS